MTIWETLGVAPGSDRDTVRRGYARKLKATHPEDDPEGFKTLREAYELALEHIEHVARWGDAADGDVEGEGADEQGANGEGANEEGASEDSGDEDANAASLFGDAPLRPPAFRSETVPPEPAGGPEPGEISALLAARERERAALHHAMRGLDQALRGTWRASDAELEALFNDILAAPALGEIALRSEAELWAAELIAETIPRSDAILLQAVTHFGWNDDPHRPLSYAVAACLERLDEWRIIQELGHHSHRFHGAWRSLTRPAGAWWSWRIDAFRPGLETGVATLLGLRGPVAGGLHFSFKRDSVERWQRFLARPHLTLTLFASLPAAALIAFVIGASLNPDPSAASPDTLGLWLTLAAALLAPVLLFALHVLRFRNEARGLAGWGRDGWMPGYVALAALAPLLPVSPWSVAGFGAGALLLWGWMTATTPPAPRAQIAASVKALWLPVLGLGLVGLIALAGFPVPQALILCGMLPLYLLVRLGGWGSGVEALRGFLEDRPWLAPAMTAAVLVPATGIVLAALGKMPGYFWFYAAALVLLGTAPLLAAMQGLSTVWAQQTVRIVRIVLFVGLGTAWFATIDSYPRPKPAAEAPVVPTDPAAPGTLRGDIAAALHERTTRQALVTLQVGQPGFGQIERGNPALYAAIRAVIDEGLRESRPADATANAIVALLAQSYAERLASADDSLLREEFVIRLARLTWLRKVSDAACVAPRTQLDEIALPEGPRRRQTAQAFNVVSNSPLSTARSAAAPLSADAWEARAVPFAGTDLAGYRRDLSGAAGAARQCRAMIARLQALVDGRALDPALLSTMRAEVRDEPAASRPVLQ